MLPLVAAMSDEWQTAPLRQFAEVSRKRIDPRLLGEQVLVHYSIPVLDETDAPATELASSIASHKFVVETDAVLVSLLNPRIPRVWLAKGGPNAVCSTEFAVLTPAVPDLDVEFLHLMCQSQTFWEELQKRAVGTTGSRQRAKAEGLLGIEVSVPALTVQRRIVDLMTHLDSHLANLRAEREGLSEVLALTRALMMDESDLTPLADLADTDGIQIGPFGSQLHAHEYTLQGTPVVMPRDLVDGRVSTAKIKRVSAEVADRLSRHRLQAGDIVFPRRGDLSKRALITSAEDGWLCGTGCIRFRPAATVDGAQVFQSISGSAVTDWLVEHAVGTTMLNLNSQIVSALPVASPSEEAAPIGAASLGLSDTMDALGREVSTLLELRAALLASLLTGELTIDAEYDLILGEAA